MSNDYFGLEDEVVGGANGGPAVEGTMMPPEAVGALPAGTGMLQVRSSYSVAVRVEKKRDLNDVGRRLLEEANFMGEGAYYGWGKGQDRIEGPSQELALAAARVWGNCAIEVAPIQETPDSWMITTYFIDLETGFTMGRPFRMSKRWTVAGKLDAERKADVRFQIGATKSARNVVLKSLPGWLIDKAMDQAKAGVRGKLEKYITAKGLPAAQDMALSVLLKVGVKEEDVLRKFGIANRAALDVDKLVLIQGDIKAIQSGEARPEEIYPSADAPNGGAQQQPAGSALGSFAAKGGNGGDQGAPAVAASPVEQSAAVSILARERRLSPAQITEIRKLAAAAGVSIDEIENQYGAPLAEIEIDGKGAKGVEGAIVDLIRETAKRKK